MDANAGTACNVPFPSIAKWRQPNHPLTRGEQSQAYRVVIIIILPPPTKASSKLHPVRRSKHQDFSSHTRLRSICRQCLISTRPPFRLLRPSSSTRSGSRRRDRNQIPAHHRGFLTGWRIVNGGTTLIRHWRSAAILALCHGHQTVCEAAPLNHSVVVSSILLQREILWLRSHAYEHYCLNESSAFSWNRIVATKSSGQSHWAKTLSAEFVRAEA